ncbi:MAG: hypothetical protein QNJ37_21730 [Crocosphaera sp.]|nr:hypothetical protein [Crocosphaera sp.]
MKKIKHQIRLESSRTVKFSQEAKKAFEAKNWQQGKALMEKAVTASKKSQELIKQLQKASATNKIIT